MISQLGKTLYERLRTLSSHFADIRRGLDRAVEAYKKAVGSFEGSVLVSARKFKELGASTGEEIDGLEGIDTSIRKIGEDNSTEGAFPEGANKEMVLPAGEE